MKQTLENLSDDEMSSLTADVLTGGKVTVKGFDEEFDSNIFSVQTKTKKGIVSAEFAQESVVALDVVLTDSLLREGAVRDVIRQCQLIRKEAGYQVEQRVNVAISVDDKFLLDALNDKKDYIMNELLADSLVFNETIVSDLTKEFAVNEKNIAVSVSKGE